MPNERIQKQNSAFLYQYQGTALPPQTLTDRDLEQVLTGLVGLAVEALDLESYLLWWRDDLRAFPLMDTNQMKEGI